MINTRVGQEISRIFREMGRALADGTWDKETFLRLRDEARKVLPPGAPTPSFLMSDAHDAWLKPEERVKFGPTFHLKTK